MQKSIARRIPRRVIAPSAGVKSRSEAAVELVRLEYERQRLTQSLTALAARVETEQTNLAAVDARIDWLTGIISAKPSTPKVAAPIQSKPLKRGLQQ